MAEISIECALAIQPMIQLLYKDGIIDIHGADNKIHCTNEFFFAAFNDYKSADHGGDYTEIYHYEDGARWFCLVPKEGV